MATEPDLRTDRPHPARIYDFHLGGTTNYEADRAVGAKVLEVMPTIPVAARSARGFMKRATRYLAVEHGIRQFLDIGTGIPTEPNLHQVAQGTTPDARVVYVDNDPIVLAHARALLRGHPHGRTAYHQGDLRRPEEILSSPALRETLDLSQPVALSLNAVMHFVLDDEGPHEILRTLLDALPSGSFLEMSHGTADLLPDHVLKGVAEYAKGGVPVQMRTRAEVEAFFTGLHMIDPGLTLTHRWHNTLPASELPADQDISIYAAVARIP